METNWSKEIQQLILNKCQKKIFINWSFYAHHYKNKYISWKSNPYFGGGALNFYCIHFIAWLCSFSKWNVIYCSPLSNKTNDSMVTFELFDEVTNTTLKMKCNSINKKLNFFQITENEKNAILNIKNPFIENNSKHHSILHDVRVPYLIKIIKKVQMFIDQVLLKSI